MSLFMTDAFTRLRTSGLISLCLINGPAVGGGSELITVCDYR
jgi:enoyl-CoA hydratase/carnithine racemase